MELTATQFRAITKAKNLLVKLAGRMDGDEKTLLNEICSDWGDIVLYPQNYDANREDVKKAW